MTSKKTCRALTLYSWSFHHYRNKLAESFGRLREGKDIQEHDIILSRHESYEYELMKNNPDLYYEEAHAITEKKYNYGLALLKWKKEHKQ